jgi:hypothetical protein
MDDLTRRGALALAAATGAAVFAAHGADDDKDAPKPAKTDRDFVIGAGMTEAEADCWDLAAKTAGAFFALPKMHPMDDHEIAHAIHIIQNKLLSRPTYRKYLELAKAKK